MAFSITNPHRILLFSKNNPHNYYTGGWSKINDQTTAQNYIAEAPFIPSIKYEYYSDILPKDADGSMIYMIQTNQVNIATQTICMRTKSMVDFKNRKWIRFLFTRDNYGRSESIFDKQVIVRILDKNLNVLVYWDSAGKNCQYERGEINIDGISSGYVEIYLCANLKLGASALLTNSLEPLYDNAGNRLISTYIYMYNTGEYAPYFIKTKYDDYIRTTKSSGYKRLTGRKIIPYSILFQILAMWAE